MSGAKKKAEGVFFLQQYSGMVVAHGRPGLEICYSSPSIVYSFGTMNPVAIGAEFSTDTINS